MLLLEVLLQLVAAMPLETTAMQTQADFVHISVVSRNTPLLFRT
jgi:hypothetical protein